MWVETILFSKCFILMLLSNGCSCASDTSTITNVYNSSAHLEGPTWCYTENCLYWIDSTLQYVFKLNGTTGEITYKHIGYGPVTLVIPVKDYPNLLVVSVRSEAYFLSWDSFVDDSSLRLISSVDIGLPDNRFNDGKVDAKGRLWIGTMGSLSENLVVDPDRGSLYMIDYINYREPALKVRPISVSNGIAWSSDNQYMYYIDSATYNVDYFIYDLDIGRIRNRTTLFNFQANNIAGFPDGMTIDTDENLWVACFGGGKVIKINSKTGVLLDEYILPVTTVTSVTWGGANLDKLYVTTSKLSLNATQLAAQPEAGSLFVIEGTGSKGYPQNQFVFPNASTY